MKDVTGILKLTEHLYVDLETGCYRNTKNMDEKSPTQRLTKGQLQLLNFLVINREHLCTFDMLEGLFDDTLPEDSIPGIKQQLSRIKSRFRSMDPSFNKETARKIFQSISGMGYLFHMEDSCKLMYTISPLSYMSQINIPYIEGQNVRTQREKENIQRVLYQITSDNELTLQAVCNNLQVTNIEYHSLIHALISYIFKEHDHFSPIYVMSEAGTGKTTLFLSLLTDVITQHPKWNIYYLDFSNTHISKEDIQTLFEHIKKNGITRTRKNILCIDTPYHNPCAFQELYRFLANENNQYLLPIIIGRPSQMFPILENNPIYQRTSYIKAIYISNNTTCPSAPAFFRNSSIKFYDWKQFCFPVSAKMEIIFHIIETICPEFQQEKPILEHIKKSLSLEGQTIFDLFFEFKGIYKNIDFPLKNLTIEHYTPNIMMDWDEWQLLCKPLDTDCTRLKISELFPYIATCILMEIPVTFELVHWITGYPYKSKLLSLFPQGWGEPIQYVSETFILRHPRVADNYFVCHPEISFLSCLMELLRF